MMNTDLFKNRQVQDLAWVISSPPLVSGNHNDTHWWDDDKCAKEFSDCLPALVQLDKNPQPLLTHLSQLKSKRLGLRFESYISYWLTISPNYRQLKQNIQIIEEGHTYGELDFIIKNIHTGKIIHLEVAVKFYLGMVLGGVSSKDPYHWYGTNTKDQLGKKLDHLKQHQTQLTVKYSDHLQKLLGFSIDEKHCLIKGRLFYPLNTDIPPLGTNKNHLRGRWVQSSDQLSNKLFIPIEKEYWLAELEGNELNKLTVQLGIIEQERAQCYLQLNRGSLGHYQEKRRIFNLPNDFWECIN